MYANIDQQLQLVAQIDSQCASSDTLTLEAATFYKSAKKKSSCGGGKSCPRRQNQSRKGSSTMADAPVMQNKRIIESESSRSTGVSK